MDPLRSFPIVYAREWAATVAFYERLGFRKMFELGEYATLTRGDSQLGVVSGDWPKDNYGMPTKAMPWAETVAFLPDPEGNPVALARPS